MSAEQRVSEVERRPRIGVGVIIVREGTVLLGRRKNSGEWQFPGGKLEFGEEPLGCASREALEETGVIIKDPKIAFFVNSRFYEGFPIEDEH